MSQPDIIRYALAIVFCTITVPVALRVLFPRLFLKRNHPPLLPMDTVPMSFRVFLFAMVFNMAAIFTLFSFGFKTGAFYFSSVGTAAIMLSTFAYVAIFDPKNKWPNATAKQRAANAITFKK